MSYETEIEKKNYVPNIVLRFKNLYWAIRSPDSGLVVDHAGLLDQVAINPTRIDPFNSNTTINSYTFKLIDKDRVVSALFNGVTSFFQNEKVEIWVGRSMVAMPFSEYFKLPDTFITSVSRDNNSYNFASTELKNRVDRPAFNERNKLAVNILPATSNITASVPFLSTTPESGIIKIEDEFISYGTLDRVNNRFSNCVRGEKQSIPVEHEAGADIFLVNDVTGNPIDILLRLLISSGGGGPYDTLTDGAAIDSSLIDVDRFEEIRDEFFLGQQYNLSLFGVESVLKFLDEEILYPNELRIISGKNSKLSLSVLNRSIFNDDLAIMDKDTIKKQPSYQVDDNELINSVRVEFDFIEGTGQFLNSSLIEDAESITAFGRRETKSIKMKGVKSFLGGASVAQNIAQRFLERFSFPRPSITLNTHMDRSLVNLGDKTELVSDQIPNSEGELNFVETLEVLERGINWKTGDVKFKLGFTSFTGIRECYLAPSDTIIEFITSSRVRVGAGRGALYRVGWKMRLYSNETRDYINNDILTITDIVGDVLTMDTDINAAIGDSYLLKQDGDALLQENGDFILLDNLTVGSTRLMFTDYETATDTQKRYCFISDNGLRFEDNKKTYQVTL